MQRVERRPSAAAAALRVLSRAPLERCARLLVVCAWVQLAGCVSITAEPRALLQRDDGTVAVQTLACGRAMSAATAVSRAPSGAGLDPAEIRILTWNIHKQADAGWERDLRTLIAHSDLALLQEAVLEPPLQHVIESTGLRWVMASSFLLGDIDIGVLTAARIEPLASCTQRVVEPVLRLPKSAVIPGFPLRGESAMLAVPVDSSDHNPVTARLRVSRR